MNRILSSDYAKIAIACFVSGVAFGIVAFLTAPDYLFLAFAAGLVAGYFGYQVRETMAAIPEAAGRAWSGLAEIATPRINRILQQIKRAVLGKHPFLYPTMAFCIPGYFLLWTNMQPIFATASKVELIFTYGFMFILATLFIMIYTLVYECLVNMGAEANMAYFDGGKQLPSKNWTEEVRSERIAKLQAEGFREQPLTYLNSVRWACLGVGSAFWMAIVAVVCVAAACVAIPLAIAIIVLGLVFATIYWLVRLVHSSQRVLCAFDGTVGGALAYYFLVHPGMSLGEKIVVVLCSGTLAALLGVGHHKGAKFVAKYFPKKPEEETGAPAAAER